MSKATGTQTGTKPTARSRITNGSELLSGVDGRSVWARRMRDLIEAHTNDLGGPDVCSHAERSILRRVACLSVELEHLEARFALSDGATSQDLDLYQRTANSLRKLLETTGLKRRAVDVTPVLSEYIEGRAQ